MIYYCVIFVVFCVLFLLLYVYRNKNKLSEKKRFEEIKSAIRQEVFKIKETCSDEPIDEQTKRVYINVDISNKFNEIKVIKREPTEAKLKRIDDTKVMLTVSVYLFSVMDYLTSKSFYDLRRTIPKVLMELDNYKSVFNYQNIKKCRKQAINDFCRQNHFKRLPIEYKEWMQLPFVIEIDIAKDYRKVSIDYTDYWDAVIDSYVSCTDKVRRIEYLIESLTKELDHRFIHNNDEAKFVIESTKNYYEILFRKELSSLWILNSRKKKLKTKKKKRI